MSRQSQPTWLAPCPALAARINPGILPKVASDVTYVHQSSFICGNYACSFGGTNAVPSTPRHSVAKTRGPPSAALRLLLFRHLRGQRLLPRLPLLTPASTSRPSKAPRLPVAPTSRVASHSTGTAFGVPTRFERSPPSHHGCLWWHKTLHHILPRHRSCL